MKKNNSNINSSTSNTDKNDVSSFLITSFLIGYIIITLLPKMKAVNVMGIQWFYLGIINIFIGLTIYFYKKDIVEWSSFKINKIILFYFGFVLFSGISILYAENKYEGIVQFSKMLTIFSGFVLLSIAANKKTNILLNFSIAISILLFYESIIIFFEYYSKINKLDFSELRSIVKGNYGNVNIIASSFALKFPFVIYAYFHFQSKKKYFFLLTFIISIFVFIPTTSRTNYINVGLLLLIILAFNIKFKEIEKNKIKLITIILSSFLAYGIYNFIIEPKLLKTSEVLQESKQNNITENIDETSGNRFTLWNNAYQSSKESPIFGYGLENYQIQTIPFESKQRDAWRMSKFTHNDFLQIYVESGILAAVLYILLFLFGGIYALKKLLDSNSNNNDKWVSLIVLYSIIAYSFDSLLNFPLRITISQVHFVIIFFFLFSLINSEEKQIKTINSKHVLGFLILLNTVLLVPNYKYFISQFGQNKALADMNILKLSYDEVNNDLPDYPVLTEMGFPVAVLKARYLEKERKFDEALELLNKSKLHNKNVMFGETTKASIFKKLNNVDSMLYYNKKGFEMYPKVESMFVNYIVNLKNNNKLKEMQEAKKYLDKYGSNKKFDSLFNLMYTHKGKIQTKSNNENNSNSKFNLNETLANKPQQTIVTSNVNTQNSGTEISKKIKELAEKVNNSNQDWNKKLEYSLELDKLQPNNPIHTMNIGMSYYKLSKFSQAKPYLEKSLKSKYFNDGLPEFVLACNYLGQKDNSNGCKYISIAKSKGYNIPEKIAKVCN